MWLNPKVQVYTPETRAWADAVEPMVAPSPIGLDLAEPPVADGVVRVLGVHGTVSRDDTVSCTVHVMCPPDRPPAQRCPIKAVNTMTTL
jgi:hypothetical protein